MKNDTKGYHLHHTFYFFLDQGEMSTAESILQKDVSEAYKTADEILKAEEALDNKNRLKTVAAASKRKKKYHIGKVSRLCNVQTGVHFMCRMRNKIK